MQVFMNDFLTEPTEGPLRVVARHQLGISGAPFDQWMKAGPRYGTGLHTRSDGNA